MKGSVLFEGGMAFNSREGAFEKRDVLVTDGRIAEADRVPLKCERIDCTGKFVLPGLVDEHMHANEFGSMIGCNADIMCTTSGVTTCCDGGTCGASNFPQFYMYGLQRFEPHSYSYLNVSTFGNKSLCIHNEDHDPADFREDLIIEAFEKYAPVLRGLKVRMCRATLGGHGMAPLLRAVQIAAHVRDLGFRCPVVVHYDDLPENVSVSELFGALSEGDIVAHVFQCKGETIFDEDGIKPAVEDARSRGVLMDDCHGRVHYSLPNLRKALKAGFVPDIISSDLVRVSEFIRPGFSLPFAMGMESAAGMEVGDILRCVTINPAKALGIDERAGTLEAGCPADIAVFDIRDAQKDVEDFYGNTGRGKIFIPLLTMISGRVAWRQIFF
jgi:dihydroorotase